MKRHARGGLRRKERERDPDAEQERNDDAEVTDGDGRRRALAEVGRVDVESDAEHEKDDTELAEQPQDGERRLRKQERIGGRPEQADERRAEQHPGRNFSDDGWLPEQARKAADGLRRENDHEQLDDEERERTTKGGAGARRCRFGSATDVRFASGREPALAQVQHSCDHGHGCGDDECVDEDAPLHIDGGNTLLDDEPTRLLLCWCWC